MMEDKIQIKSQIGIENSLDSLNTTSLHYLVEISIVAALYSQNPNKHLSQLIPTPSIVHNNLLHKLVIKIYYKNNIKKTVQEYRG